MLVLVIRVVVMFTFTFMCKYVLVGVEGIPIRRKRPPRELPIVAAVVQRGCAFGACYYGEVGLVDRSDEWIG